MKEQHLDLIERQLMQRGTLSHRYVEKLLKLSPVTVRRLFREMAETHRALRVRGGLLAPDGGTVDDVPSIPHRAMQGIGEKELLARRAVAEFSDVGLNMIHGGTTTQRIVGYLAKGVFLTDSVLIAADLSRKHPGGDGPEILLTGGSLDIRAGFLYGPRTISAIRSYCGEVLVTSVRGVDRDGLLETDDQTVAVIRAMIDSCRRTVVIIDHRKFGIGGKCRLCSWDEIDLVITAETPENSAELRRLRRFGVSVETVPFADDTQSTAKEVFRI